MFDSRFRLFFWGCCSFHVNFDFCCFILVGPIRWSATIAQMSPWNLQLGSHLNKLRKWLMNTKLFQNPLRSINCCGKALKCSFNNELYLVCLVDCIALVMPRVISISYLLTSNCWAGYVCEGSFFRFNSTEMGKITDRLKNLSKPSFNESAHRVWALISFQPISRDFFLFVMTGFEFFRRWRRQQWRRHRQLRRHQRRQRHWRQRLPSRWWHYPETEWFHDDLKFFNLFIFSTNDFTINRDVRAIMKLRCQTQVFFA